MTRIAHISDLHLPIPGRVSMHKLLSKRILGWANIRFLRSRNHNPESFRKLLAHLCQLEKDYTVVSGDLVNLALEQEYSNVLNIFNEFGLDPKATMLIPGNHDRYTPGSQWLRAFEKACAQWQSTNVKQASAYPRFTPLGPVGIIGMDSAVWRGPVRSAGHISRSQIERLKSILDTDCRELRPVVAVHHPPFSLEQSPVKHYLSGLDNFPALLEVLAGRNAIVLHGHIHVRSIRRDGDTTIIGVPSASNESASPDKTMGYHLLDFDEKAACTVSATTYLSREERFVTRTLDV